MRCQGGNELSSPGLCRGRGAAPRRPSPRPPRRSRYSRRRAKGGGGDPPPARRAKQEAKRQRSQRSRGRPSGARLRRGGRRNYAARAKRGPLWGRRGTPRRAAAVFRPPHGGNGGPPPLASAVEGARRRRGGCDRFSGCVGARAGVSSRAGLHVVGGAGAWPCALVVRCYGWWWRSPLHTSCVFCACSGCGSAGDCVRLWPSARAGGMFGGCSRHAAAVEAFVCYGGARLACDFRGSRLFVGVLPWRTRINSRASGS